MTSSAVFPWCSRSHGPPSCLHVIVFMRSTYEPEARARFSDPAHSSVRLRGMGDDDTAILREPPVAGNETDSLIGSLERQRRIFAWKCSGLDAAGLAATVGASTMTLGGLLKHL